MRSTRALHRAGLVAALIGVAVTMAAAPAQAAPLERGTFHDVDPGSLSTNDPEWPCKDLGFAVTITSDIHGSFHFGPRKPGGVYYGQESIHGWISFSANGSTYTNVFNVLNKDQQVTDNGNGTWTLVVMGTGSDKWFLDGKLLFSNPGQFRAELLVTDPGGPNENISFVRVVKESTGLNNVPSRTFCQDLADFLAPAP